MCQRKVKKLTLNFTEDLVTNMILGVLEALLTHIDLCKFRHY